MKKGKWLLILFAARLGLPAAAWTQAANPARSAAPPHLVRQGTATQLVVEGRPLLMRAGEFDNSNGSSVASMRAIWPRLVKMNLNTALVPVYWELLEPEEGRYDFTLVDSMIRAARELELKLVLLWFGTWKNSMSCYVPCWIKADQKRFPRSRTRAGEAQEILTPFSEENLRSDRRAFAALLRHIRAVDQVHQTVVMVQVENEIGMIPEARDYVAEANRLFAAPVPAELTSYLQSRRQELHPQLRQAWEKSGFLLKGSWETVFGTGLATDELFMAWHFARYANAVAAAGKAEYPLPMFVNAALIRPDYLPGQYPSAGPLPHLMDIWRAAAPQIDFLAPDIYFDNFAELVGQFDHAGNPLFVPEVSKAQSPANAFFAIARHNAMGYSPYAVETLENPGANPLSRAYEVLRQLTPLLLANQGTKNLTGVLLDSTAQRAEFVLGDYRFFVRHEYSWQYARREEGVMPRYGGLFIRLADDEFIIAGTGLIIEFAPKSGAGRAGIGSVDEGQFVNGEWRPGRRLNGDQTHQGRHAQLPGSSYGIIKVRLYSYR